MLFFSASSSLTFLLGIRFVKTQRARFYVVSFFLLLGLSIIELPLSIVPYCLRVLAMQLSYSDTWWTIKGANLIASR